MAFVCLSEGGCCTTVSNGSVAISSSTAQCRGIREKLEGLSAVQKRRVKLETTAEGLGFELPRPTMDLFEGIVFAPEQSGLCGRQWNEGRVVLHHRVSTIPTDAAAWPRCTESPLTTSTYDHKY